MLENMVPVMKYMALGSTSMILLGDRSTHNDPNNMQIATGIKGLTASEKHRILPVRYLYDL